MKIFSLALCAVCLIGSVASSSANKTIPANATATTNQTQPVPKKNATKTVEPPAIQPVINSPNRIEFVVG